MTSPKLFRLLIATGMVGALMTFVVAGAAATAAGAAGPPRLAWSTASPATSPPYLAYAAGAYDPSTRTFVMFGGISADGVMSGATWVWDGKDWTEYSGGPSARDLSSIGFDPQLNQFVLFGGQTAQGTLLSDTWTWNGTSWYQISPSLPAPTPRDAATLAYDRDGRLVLFGGTGYTGASGPPPVGSGGGVAPAETTLADTWLWQGSTSGWTQDKVAGPPPRSGAAAAYDSQSGATVVFGGESTPSSASGQPQLLDDTWVWNGRSWAQAKPSGVPPPRFAAVADDFGPLGGPVLAGGYGTSGDLSDTWLWQGNNWTRVADQGADPARQGASGGYDAAAGELVLFGGTSGGDSLDLTSVAKLPAAASPSTTTTTVRGPTPTTVPPKKPTSTSTSIPPGRQPSSPTTMPRPPQRPPAGPSLTGPGPALTVSSGRVAKGGRLALQGSGFDPGTTVVLTLHSTPAGLGTANVGPDGRFQVTVVVPTTAATGSHEVSASGLTPAGQVLTAWANVSVYAPSTGLSSKAKAFLLGLSLLIPVLAYVGMMLYGIWRDRRSGRVTDPANAPRSLS